MHGATRDLTWTVAVLGAGVLIAGLAGLRFGRDPQPSRAALRRCWSGLFVCIETIPRLADWPSGVVLALSMVAFAPLLLAARTLQRP